MACRARAWARACGGRGDVQLDGAVDRPRPGARRQRPARRRDVRRVVRRDLGSRRHRRRDPRRSIVAPLDLAAWPPRAAAEAGIGLVEALVVAPAAEAPVVLVDAALAIGGRGLQGDRYATAAGTFASGRPGSALTLVDAAVLDTFGRDIDHRRNVVVGGTDLNALVGREFMLGEARCRGRRLCERPPRPPQRRRRPATARAPRRIALRRHQRRHCPRRRPADASLSPHMRRGTSGSAGGRHFAVGMDEGQRRRTGVAARPLSDESRGECRSIASKCSRLRHCA